MMARNFASGVPLTAHTRQFKNVNREPVCKQPCSAYVPASGTLPAMGLHWTCSAVRKVGAGGATSVNFVVIIGVQLVHQSQCLAVLGRRFLMPGRVTPTTSRRSVSSVPRPTHTKHATERRLEENGATSGTLL